MQENDTSFDGGKQFFLRLILPFATNIVAGGGKPREIAEWLVNTKLYDSIFEHDYEEEPLDLIACTFVLMKELHQSHETIMKLPWEDRKQYLALLQAVNKKDKNG